MKLTRSYKVDIPNHCSKGWDEMKDCGENKSCLTCEKIVYDFTKKTDFEIYETLKSLDEKRICGRLTSSQLNKPLKKTPSIFNRLIKFLLPTAFIIGINETKAVDLEHKKSDLHIIEKIGENDTIKISGQVVDLETNEPLIYAIVYLEGTRTQVVTDENGKFELILTSEIISKNNSLLFTSLGYEEQIVEVDSSGYSNIIIKMKSGQELIGEIIIKEPSLMKRIFKRRRKS